MAIGRWFRSAINASTILLVGIAASAIDAGRGSADAATWCLVGYGRDCSFHTFEQCLASRAGGATFCEQNPNFTRSGPGRPPRSGQRR
jgi:hypothetical protein